MQSPGGAILSTRLDPDCFHVLATGKHRWSRDHRFCVVCKGMDPKRRPECRAYTTGGHICTTEADVGSDFCTLHNLVRISGARRT